MTAPIIFLPPPPHAHEHAFIKNEKHANSIHSSNLYIKLCSLLLLNLILGYFNVKSL